MSFWLLAGSLVLTMLQDQKAAAATAADEVTLRDGQVALGQVADSAPRGKVVLLVRREWVEEHLTDWAKKWEAAEAAWVPRARRERRERLLAWRRDRGVAPEGRGDAITAWLDQELVRLTDAVVLPPSPLMAVQISRSEVRSTVRRSRETGRLLRQGWLAGFANVETMPLDELKQALAGRGFALNGTDAASVDSLLPFMPEPEARWQMRRAATEVTNDSGLRFVRAHGLVFPEGATAATEGVTALTSVVKNLFDDKPPEDPLPATFHSISARGRTGLVLTRLDMAPDFSSVTVECTLWVRRGRDHWEQAAVRTATVNPSTLGQGAGKPLAADPQVKAAFDLVDSLGLGQVGAEIRDRSLNVGAAAQKALGMAREALDHDLELLALSINSSQPAEPARDLEPRRDKKPSGENAGPFQGIFTSRRRVPNLSCKPGNSCEPPRM